MRREMAAIATPHTRWGIRSNRSNADLCTAGIGAIAFLGLIFQIFFEDVFPG